MFAGTYARSDDCAVRFQYMPAEDSRDRKRPSLVRRLFGRSLPLETETTLFILASALDVFMTHIVLTYSEARFTSYVIGEGNPVARYFINHWGPQGMVYFKFSVTAVVVLLAQAIAIRRLRVAKRLLDFGTALVACAVIYSFVLLLHAW